MLPGGEKMNLRDFYFHFKPKNTIRLVINNNNKNLDFKELIFNFREHDIQVYNYLARIYGSCMFIDKIEISIYFELTTIEVSCNNIDYNHILSFLESNGC